MYISWGWFIAIELVVLGSLGVVLYNFVKFLRSKNCKKGDV